jgi:Flp pilus assembly protein TadG
MPRNAFLSKRQTNIHLRLTTRPYGGEVARVIPNRRAQSLVELALLLPLVTMLLLGGVEFGRAFAAGLTASSVARQAAGYAAQHQADGTSAGGSCAKAWGQTIDVALAAGSGLGLTCASVGVVPGSTDPYGRTPVTVTITAPFQALTPFVGQVLGLHQVAGTSTGRGETW